MVTQPQSVLLIDQNKCSIQTKLEFTLDLEKLNLSDLLCSFEFSFAFLSFSISNDLGVDRNHKQSLIRSEVCKQFKCGVSRRETEKQGGILKAGQ